LFGQIISDVKEVEWMPRIGVEESLTQVQQALRERGYEVVPLKQESDARGCDCCVITGQDVNVMGMQDTVTAGPVIDARGLNAEDVCREIDGRFH
jgi:hypothetical protein